MIEQLKGKTALVTGGSKGIGLAIASVLAEAGVNVAICARQEKELRQAVEHLQTIAPRVKSAGRVTDVSQAASVDELFGWLDAAMGGLDILVNNAGLGIFRPMAELTVEEWDRMLGVNLSGTFYCSRLAIPRLRQAGGGSIINVSSLAGRNPFAGGSGYNASKFGMNGFSEATMLDHRDDGIRVSYIMPGSVDTGFSGSEVKSDWKIAPEDVAQIALQILTMPARTLISRVEVRPSRPKKH